MWEHLLLTRTVPEELDEICQLNQELEEKVSQLEKEKEMAKEPEK